MEHTSEGDPRGPEDLRRGEVYLDWLKDSGHRWMIAAKETEEGLPDEVDWVIHRGIGPREAEATAD